MKYNDFSVVGMFGKEAYRMEFQVHTLLKMTNYCSGVSGKLQGIKEISKDEAALAVTYKNVSQVIIYSITKKILLKTHKTQLFIRNLFLDKDKLFIIGK